MVPDEVALSAGKVEPRRCGQPEIDEVDPTTIGARIAEVPVHMQQLAATQERHDFGQLLFDRLCSADRIFV
ncbi:hypothetical protein [Micromonospora peucetia]|uniref:FXSXX-COOH protein n=1 Tax=Micromonospora peucetia TaxID=47871 RepID=A0ABZ1EFT8_9ACTN|nr:hypothetical protein [Micromonospora peucetia]WSA32644.1 hypothetical protein OIE14_00695 [Micromonospora peucetia]